MLNNCKLNRTTIYENFYNDFRPDKGDNGGLGTQTPPLSSLSEFQKKKTSNLHLHAFLRLSILEHAAAFHESAQSRPRRRNNRFVFVCFGASIAASAWRVQLEYVLRRKTFQLIHYSSD